MEKVGPENKTSANGRKREVIEIKVSSHPKMMRVLRAVSEEIGNLAGLNDEQIVHLQIAIDEAATNIIRHGYKFDSAKDFKLIFNLMDDRLEVLLEDNASPFHPKSSDFLSSVEPTGGGLGVTLIHRAVDEVDYCVTRSGSNQLRLVKYLTGKEVRNREGIVETGK